MANGVADNMLVTTYLSAKSQVFVAPAMDLDMMAHPSTTRNIESLKSYGNIIIEPQSGFLASGLTGKGRMEEPENIVGVVADFFASRSDSSLVGKKVLVTAGPTYEKIDPVRFIGNYSSGKMGFALAEECAARGAEVTLVAGPVALTTHHPSIRRIDVESAREMLDACTASFPDADIAIMCAAVADYRPEQMTDKKIKREHTEVPTLRMVKNPDIAATLGKAKRPGQVLVGFALETDNEVANAVEKLERKNLDYIVLNSMRVAGAGFGTDTNAVSIISPQGTVKDVPLMSKDKVAGEIITAITQKI